MASSEYDHIVFDFFKNEKSGVILVSEDVLFQKTLRGTLNKVLGVRRECLQVFHKTEAATKAIKERMGRKHPTILFSESLIGGRMATAFLSTVKEAWPKLHIIALVGETRREDIAYLYEIGAGNVIAKPASMNNIIEKIAFTLRPQGKLTEYIGAAKSYLERMEPKKVLSICQKVLDIKPGSPTAYMLIGDAYQFMGKEDKALEAYLEAHRNAPVFIEPLKRLASFFAHSDLGEHLGYLMKLDKLSPLNAERKRDIGAAHFQQGDMEQAEAFFDQAMECATREASSLIEDIASSIAELVAEKSPAMSEKYLEKVIKAKGASLSRSDLETFNRLGIVLKKQGKWKKAIEYYEKALKIAPDDEGLYYNMGMAYFEGGDSNSAARNFEKALKINPIFFMGNATVCKNLGNVFFSLGEYNKAETFFATALKANPKHSESQQMLKRIGQARQKAS